MKPPRVSIIVLCHNRWGDTRRCLDALRRFTPSSLYEVLAYDNASSDGTFGRLTRLARGWPRLRVLRNERNLPFSEAVNTGMREARGDFFLWLNNDAVPGPGWLEGLLAAAASAGAAAVGPMTDRMAPLEQRCEPFATRSRGRVEEAAFLGGFCFLVERKAAERAGFLDERFEWGWEDMDYCLRLRQAGEKLALARDVFVRHAGSRTLRTKPSRWRQAKDFANRRLVLRKWASGEPQRSDFLDLYERMPSPWRSIGPGVSVVLVCAGRASAARASLAALRRAAAGRDCEVLAVDASGGRLTRSLRNEARRWPAVKVLGPWRGHSLPRAFNRAAVMASGDHLAFLDARSIVSPGWLESLRSALRGRPDVGAARPAAEPFGFLVRRGVFARVGGFEERFPRAFHAADYCRRVLDAGFPVVAAAGARVRRPKDAPSAAERALAVDKGYIPRPEPKPKSKPLVSVLLICRGGASRALRSLESVRRCAGSIPYEVLVVAVGAAPRARLAALARRWPQLRVLGHWPAMHEANGLNVALGQARGDYAALLSAGVSATPGWLSGLLRAARADRDAAAVAPVCAQSRLSWQAKAPAGRPRRVKYVRGHCLLIPLAALGRVGEFDERFRRDLHVEDFCLRADRRGLGILVTPRARVRKLGGGGFPTASTHDREFLFLHKWAGQALLPNE